MNLEIEIMKNALLREMKEPQNLFEKESLNLLAKLHSTKQIRL